MKIYTCLHLSHDCLMKNLIFTPTSSLLAIRILTFFLQYLNQCDKSQIENKTCINQNFFFNSLL